MSPEDLEDNRVLEPKGARTKGAAPGKTINHPLIAIRAVTRRFCGTNGRALYSKHRFILYQTQSDRFAISFVTLASLADADFSNPTLGLAQNHSLLAATAAGSK